jgi:hypothetical protein
MSALRCILALAGGIALDTAAGMLPAPVRASPALPRVAAIAVSSATLALPFLIDAPPVLRAVLAVLLAVGFGRVVEIARSPWRFQRPERVVRLATILETRLMRRVPRSAAGAAWLAAAAFTAAGLLVLVLAFRAGPPVEPYAAAGWPRWLLGAAGGYLLFEGLMRALVAVLPPFGWEHAAVQRMPIRSRSLAEFWGLRWNRVVGLWLQRNLFDPAARRGSPRLGILLAFAVSALLHFYLVVPAVGLVPALWMGLFFLAHGALAAVERALGVKEWPAALGHAWALACFLVTLPLFCEPMLRILG